MKEAPKIITKTRRVGTIEEQKNFKFTADLIPTGLSLGLQHYRQNAWKDYERILMPSMKEEAWRRTDIRGIKADLFNIPGKNAYLDLEPVPQDLLRPIAGDVHSGQIVLMPGGSRVELDSDLAAKGVIFTDWLTAEKQYPELVERCLGKIIKPEEGKFAALTAAVANTGAFLYIPKGVQIEQPLHSILWGAGTGMAMFSHLLIWLEGGATATYVHEAASLSGLGNQNLHGGIVEIYVGDGANLRFVELQSWGDDVWNFSHERARVDRDGNLEWIFGAVGTHLTKNFSDIDLIGEGSTARISGFYFANGNQHLDHDTQQNHLAPHTTSDLLYKGALRDESRSVWQGMIYVAPGAMKTDGYQANRNLVLSKKARADSIPGLEILADDVRCTHGATVGQVDPEEVFYLLSRGIPASEAERLIVEGFFDPIMQRIPFEGVRLRFQQAIEQKMTGKNS